MILKIFGMQYKNDKPFDFKLLCNVINLPKMTGNYCYLFNRFLKKIREILMIKLLKVYENINYFSSLNKFDSVFTAFDEYCYKQVELFIKE